MNLFIFFAFFKKYFQGCRFPCKVLMSESKSDFPKLNQGGHFFFFFSREFKRFCFSVQTYPQHETQIHPVHQDFPRDFRFSC